MLCFICLSIQGLDGTLLSLALTYAMAFSNQAFAYILWTCGDVESYVRNATVIHRETLNL